MNVSNKKVSKTKERILEILSDNVPRTKNEIYAEYVSKYHGVDEKEFYLEEKNQGKKFPITKVPTITGRCTELREEHLIGLVKEDLAKEHPVGTTDNLKLEGTGAYYQIANKENLPNLSFNPTRVAKDELKEILNILNSPDRKKAKFFLIVLREQLGDLEKKDIIDIIKEVRKKYE